jgi:hypothetical protein
MMTLMDMFKPKEKDKEIYEFLCKDECDEIVFAWFVYDAYYGFNCFRYDRPQDRKTEPEFMQWFKNKSEAIEYCVDQARAEKMAKGY